MKVFTSYLLLLFFALTTWTSCIPEMLPQPRYEYIDDDFEYGITPKTCQVQGTAYQINIQHPEHYSYLWEVDGQALGHGQKTPCVCGSQVTVHVTRLKDGKRKQKLSPIPSCERD